MSNRFSRLIKKVQLLPKKIQPYVLTKVFCSKVKYAGTSGINIRSVANDRVEIKLANRSKVQNHIGGVHAVAAAVLAESATGIVFGMNVPDSCIPLLKSMHIDYQQRMQGDLTAIATLSQQQRQQIMGAEKGAIVIPVEITDESNQQPLCCQMEWAWVPKKR